MKTKAFYSGLILLLLVAIYSCDSQKNNQAVASNPEEPKQQKQVFVPDFNADSAYFYTEKQVGFGPRVPNTAAHSKCATYLVNTLKRFTKDVQVQTFKAYSFDKKALNGKNIIASFNPEKKLRILLAAHWDSRPFADHDPDPENWQKPVLGANDGASGVAVLLEIARQLSLHPSEAGIDIIFYDLEDYGSPQTLQTNVLDDWALGSQYWSRNPHILNYRAKYGILLDMVGAKGAVFRKEGTSMQYAYYVMDKVWAIAHEAGYGGYFANETSGNIIDDHYYVNTLAKIPMIDIIHHDGNTKSGFFRQWHTTYDDMMNIDKEVLKATGQVVLTVIYRES
jgi:Zn-dependent M28 family amino/carboxypeptidase